MSEPTLENICALLDTNDATKFDFLELKRKFGKNSEELLRFMISALDEGLAGELEGKGDYELAKIVNSLLQSEAGLKVMKPGRCRRVLLDLAREVTPNLPAKVAKLIRATDAERRSFDSAIVSRHAALMRSNHFRDADEVLAQQLFERWE